MPILLRRILQLTSLSVTSMSLSASCATAQMSEREADARIRGMARAVNKVAFKKVLMAGAAALQGYIQAHDAVLARYAIDEAERRRDESLVPALTARVADRRDTAMSAAAARVLGALSGPQSKPALHNAIQDPRLDVRAEAGVALAASGDRDAIPALRHALDSPTSTAPYYAVSRPDPRLQIAAAAYLSIFHDRRSIPRILRLTGELNECDRRRLCSSLGRFGGPACERKLRQMVAREPYSGTRGRAALTLGELRNLPAVTVLISALRDRGPDVRWAAAQALEAIGDRRAIPALERAAIEISPGADNSPRMEAAAHVAAREAADVLAHPGVAGSAAHYRPIADVGLWEKAHPEARSMGFDSRRLRRLRYVAKARGAR